MRRIFITKKLNNYKGNDINSIWIRNENFADQFYYMFLQYDEPFFWNY